jgi:hypothetical protein
MGGLTKGRRPIATRLDNLGSFDLNVDGSSTPQVFAFQALANDDAMITELQLILEDNNDIDFGNRFMGLGSGSILANGIAIDVRTEEAAIHVQTIKTTRGLLRFASSGNFELHSGTGFRYIVKASRDFPDGLLIRRAGTHPTDDFFSVTISDDLSALTYGVATVFGFRL